MFGLYFCSPFLLRVPFAIVPFFLTFVIPYVFYFAFKVFGCTKDGTEISGIFVLKFFVSVVYSFYLFNL